MSTHDSGVTELLRRASDDLAPDIDRLVRGGITRGRSRQRRARIGTTVASLAVIGVVGALAAVVPHHGPDTARDPGIADDGGVVASETPTPAPTPPPAAAVTVPAVDVPATVDAILGTTLAQPAAPGEFGEDDSEVVSHFLYDGMLTSIIITPGGSLSHEQCLEQHSKDPTSFPGEQGCALLDDGTVVEVRRPETGDGVTSQGVTAYRRGFTIVAMSYNAAEGKDVPTLAPNPRLGVEQLVNIAASDAWFE